jgi:hypothetical protein
MKVKGSLFGGRNSRSREKERRGQWGAHD